MKKYIILGTVLFSFGMVTNTYADSPTVQDTIKGALTSDTSLNTVSEYKEKISKLSELNDKEKNDFYEKLYKASSKTDFENVLKEASSKNTIYLEKKQEQEELERIEKEKAKIENSKKPLKVFEVTAIYESNNRNPGAILGVLNDGAGMNYGTYSLTQKYTMKPYLAFLEKYYPELRAQLTGEVGTEEFNNSWKKLGENDSEKFQTTQAQYLFENNIIPALEKLKSETGVDFLDGSHSVGAVGMISGMIHNAGYAWYPIIKNAANEVKNNNEHFNDQEFVEKIGGWVRDNYSGVYTQSIRNRYSKQTPQEKERTEIFSYTKKESE